MALDRDYTYNAGSGGGFAKYALEYTPDDPDWHLRRPVHIKCALCPRWAGQHTTALEASRVFRAHQELRHG